MSAFSECLHRLIQSRELSISKLSRESGVERTSIHKALAGERILPYRALEQLAQCLELSPGEWQVLRRTFEQLFEGEGIRRERETIDEIFSRLTELAGSGHGRKYFFEDALLDGPGQDGEIVQGEEAVSRLVYAVAAEEAVHGEAVLEMAVPPDRRMVTECVERLYGIGMSVSHILCFEASGSTEEYSLRNLRALGCTLPGYLLSDRRYRAYYYYNDRLRTRYVDPLPYFLVTHGGAVCFSEDCRTAIFLKGSERARYFRIHFRQMRKQCHALAEYREAGEPADGAEGLLLREDSKGSCVIMAQPCMDAERNGASIFTRNGVGAFLRTGQRRKLLDGTVEEVGKEERLALAHSFLERLRSGAVRGRMVDDMLFTLPDSLAVLTSERFCLFSCGEDGRRIQIQEHSLCRAFHSWSAHFEDSDLVFGKERTEEILEGMIR